MTLEEMKTINKLIERYNDWKKMIEAMDNVGLSDRLYDEVIEPYHDLVADMAKEAGRHKEDFYAQWEAGDIDDDETKHELEALTSTISVYQSKGFIIIQTGGGCTAFYKEVGEDVILITENGGCSIPETFDKAICVGTYDKELYNKGDFQCYIECCIIYPNSTDYLKTLEV